MVMGLDPKHGTTDYWSTSPVLQNKFISSTMPRNMLERSQRYIHLAPVTGNPGNKQDSPLYKINPLPDYVKKARNTK